MLTLESFEQASEIVKQVTQETKLIKSSYFSELTGNKVYLKPENMQRTGAYKVRGAYYKISTLSDEERNKGLITASAGNHAQGVAYAAHLRNIAHPVQHRAGLAGQQVIGHQLLGRAKGVLLIGILRGIIECIRRQVNIALGLELVLRLLLQWLVKPSACRLGSICLAASAQCQYRYHTK